MNLRVLLSGLAYSTIFRLSFLFTKNALDYVTPLTFLSFRFIVAFLTYLLLLITGVVKLGKKPYWKLWKLVLFRPVFYFIFETCGLQRVNFLEAGMIIALIPVVVNLLAPFILKEKFSFPCMKWRARTLPKGQPDGPRTDRFCEARCFRCTRDLPESIRAL